MAKSWTEYSFGSFFSIAIRWFCCKFLKLIYIDESGEFWLNLRCWSVYRKLLIMQKLEEDERSRQGPQRLICDLPISDIALFGTLK